MERAGNRGVGAARSHTSSRCCAAKMLSEGLTDSSPSAEGSDDPLADAKTVKAGRLWIRGDLLILNAENFEEENAFGCTEKVTRTHRMIPLRQITGMEVGYVNVKNPSNLVLAALGVAFGAGLWMYGPEYDIDMREAKWYWQYGPFIFAALCVAAYYAGTESEMTLTIESATTKMEIAYATKGSKPEKDTDKFRTCEAYKASMIVDEARQDLVMRDAIEGMRTKERMAALLAARGAEAV